MIGNISEVALENFMIFNKLSVKFSNGINVISGGNSTGKTALLKILYSVVKSLSEMEKAKSVNKDIIENKFTEKMQGVFRPDEDTIGRLVSRKQGSNKASIEIKLTNHKKITLKIGSRQKNHVDLMLPDDIGNIGSHIVYIPPKEIIASTENFGALYREYQIAFEETYADLCAMLEKPLKRGKYSNEQTAVLENFFDVMNGKVVQRNRKFYLRVEGAGEFEMGLVSEGYRKLASIAYLIQNGSLDKNSILFWDEPESNMNPKVIWPLVQGIIKLAESGVQVFVTTHSYFVQQAFNIQKSSISADKIRFFSLYLDNADVKVEMSDDISDLQHNDVMAEFDALYDREQEQFHEI